MAAAPAGNLLLPRAGSPLRGWILLAGGGILLAAVALAAVLGGWGEAGEAAHVAGQAAFAVAGIISVAILAAIVTDAGVRSVARYTLIQCLRMKLTAVFVVLIAVAIAGVYHVKGDGTLGGRIRNFLAYSNGLVSLLLSLLTIFLGIFVVASDVEKKQIFTLATKPLARWEYIVGRWLGVVMLAAVLLLPAGLSIYALAQHLRGKGEHMSFPDRRTVETEVFVARKRVRPQPVPVDKLVAARIEELHQQGLYRATLVDFLDKAKGDEKLAAELLRKELAKQETQRVQSIAPMRQMRLTFSGIDVDSAEVRASGRVVEVSRDARLVRIEVAPRTTGHVVVGAPVKVNGVEARVYGVGRGFVDVRFAEEDMAMAKVQALAAGRSADLILVSSIQLAYKAEAAGKLRDDEQLRGGWLLVNPGNGTAQRAPPHDIPLDSRQTFTASAAVVSDDGRVMTWFTNLSRVSIFLNRENLAILFPVGSFDGNFSRSVVLVLMRCAFLAGLAVLAGSFLSFPVSCFACLVLYVMALGRGYITDAVKLRPYVDTDVVTFMGHYVMKVMSVLLPNFAQSSPVDFLVDGMYISWGFFAEAAVMIVAFRTMILLALACLIFRQRELARVQV